MKKFSLLLALVLLVYSGMASAQGTTISTNQIRDGAITDAKVSSSANISYLKLNFTGMDVGTFLHAEYPLTFNTPLSRTGNTISMLINPVTLGGTGLGTVAAGHILFGLNGTNLATSNNFTFNSGTNIMTLTGAMTVTGTTTLNGKQYTWPASYGAAGSALIDAAGDGILSWSAPASTGVTLQASDPGTPDTGGINVSASAYALHLGLEGQTTRPTSSWTGGPLPVASLWNVSAVGTDQGGTGPSQNAISWTDNTTGYLMYLYNSDGGAHGNGIFVANGSSDPAARALTANSTGSDKFAIYTNGQTYFSPDNGGLPVATDSNAAAFINVGPVTGVNTTDYFGIRYNNTVATGFTAGDNWTGLDMEFRYADVTSLTNPRGGIISFTTAGDISGTARGLATSATLNATTGTQTAPEVTGIRSIAELSGAGTHDVQNTGNGVLASILADVYLDGGTNAVDNTYGILTTNNFAGSTSSTITNAYGVKLNNVGDANSTVTNQFGFYYTHPAAGTISNEIGVYVDSVPFSATNYAIYVAGGKSHFNGPLSAVYLQETVGAPVADAATISPSQGNIFHVTGTGTPIATITVPYTGFTGTIILIADDAGGFTTTTGGNIAIGSTVTQNHTISMTYDGTSWYPSY